MSTTIGLIAEGASSNIESDGKNTKTYTRTYLVRTDVSRAVATEGFLSSAVGILPGSPYFNDPFATAKSLEISHPEMTRPPYLAYHLKYEWATNAPLPLSADTDPTTRRVLWVLRPSIQTRYIVRDRLGNMILNAAGQPFDGGIPVDVRLGTAIAKKNRDAAGYNRDAALGNSGKINSVSYLGGAPGTVQVDIEAEEKFEGGYHFWEETYTFAYDPAGWQPKPMNAGLYQREAAGSNVLVRIQMPQPPVPAGEVPQDVMEPEPLTTAGLIVPVANRPTGCNFITVDAYASMDFTQFGL